MYKSQGPYNVWFQLLKRVVVYKAGHNIETYKVDFKSKCSLINYSTNDVNQASLKNTTSNWSFETRYHPDIQTGDRILILNDNTVYDIVGEPENVRMMNKFTKCKLVRAVGEKRVH
jgi:head-tail adaptor